MSTDGSRSAPCLPIPAVEGSPVMGASRAAKSGINEAKTGLFQENDSP